MSQEISETIEIEDLVVGDEITLKLRYTSGLRVQYDGVVTSVLTYPERGYIAVRLNDEKFLTLKDDGMPLRRHTVITKWNFPKED